MHICLGTEMLDSRLWLDNPESKIVFITLLLSMDKDGIARFGTARNVGLRANVLIERREIPEAILKRLQSQYGLIEEVEDGWKINNADMYRNVLRKEQNRQRIANWRKAQKEMKNGIHENL